MANISQITGRDSCEIHQPSIIFHIPVQRRNCITDIQCGESQQFLAGREEVIGQPVGQRLQTAHRWDIQQ
jgi:hypothetical protein